MDAIITAGGMLSTDDPLYALTGIEKKALIPLVGQPMIRWVVDALIGSSVVDNIVVVGLEPDEIDLGDSPQYVSAQGGLIENALAALERLQAINPATQKVLLSSSDIPLITAQTVRGFVEECGSQEADVYYTVVEKKAMETRFPNSKRTFFPLKGGRYSGGDLFLCDAEVPQKIDQELIRSLIGSRKNYWNQARLVGLGFIIKFMFGRMTIHDVAKRGSEILNIDARAVVTDFAELGMDLDKAHQYEIIKAELEKRETQLSQTQ